MKHISRITLALVAALVSACTVTSPTATPSPQPPTPALVITLLPSPLPATPTAASGTAVVTQVPSPLPPTPTAASGTAVGTPAQRSPLPSPTPAATETVVVFERSGSLAGKSLTLTWTIYPTGRVVGGSGAEWRADATQMAAFKTAVDQVLARSTTSPAQRPCADCLTYTFRIQRGAKTVTLSTNDATANPQDLETLLRAASVLAK